MCTEASGPGFACVPPRAVIPGSLSCSWIGFTLVSVPGAVRTPQVLPSGDPGHVPRTYRVCSGAHSCPQPRATTPAHEDHGGKCVFLVAFPTASAPAARLGDLWPWPLGLWTVAGVRPAGPGLLAVSTRSPHPHPLSSPPRGKDRAIFPNSAHRIPPWPRPTAPPLLGRCLRLPRSRAAWKPALLGPSPAHPNPCPGCLRDGLIPKS